MREQIEEEIWRSIDGYENLYEVSNLGRVRSLDRYVSNGKSVRLAKGRFLTLKNNGKGYLYVDLYTQTSCKSIH